MRLPTKGWVRDYITTKISGKFCRRLTVGVHGGAGALSEFQGDISTIF